MKSTLFLILLSAVLYPSGVFALPPIAAAGFAVVELFTSEGCSSCPPSDEVLARLVQAADREHLPVFALEWHVDYWDSLGWKDPFDSHLATERQYAYSRALPSSVYTPQTVINGSLVPTYAGDYAQVDSIVRALAGGRPAAGLSLQVHAGPRTGAGSAASSWRVSAEITGAPAGSVLLLALVEAGLGARPTAGENEGRTLMHSNVVRSVVTGPAASGESLVTAGADIDPLRCRIIGLLQDPGSLRIYAAAQAFLPAAAGSRISGRVVDGTGRGVAGILVQACSGTRCIPSLTGKDGSFAIQGAEPGQYRVIAGPRRSVMPVVTVGRADVSLDRPIVLGG